MVATRTSPTNISFALLANLTAWDFGYISTETLVARTEQTLDALEKLERYRGHFYNWYDTRTLKPLPPLYISSVDSGNLAGGLVAMRAGLREVARGSAFPRQIWSGIQDTLLAIAEEAARGAPAAVLETISEAELLLVGVPGDPDGIRQRLGELLQCAARLRQAAAGDAELHDWADFLERHCRDHLQRRSVTPVSVTRATQTLPDGRARR